METTKAIESFPEFQSLTETEQTAFEVPSDLGSEDQSDILSYQKPESWEYDWLTRSAALDAAAGSVSPSHFLIDNRFKIHKPLNDLFEFRFTYTDERNRERDSTHHIFEMLAWPKSFLGIGFYGEPSLNKRETDTGLALFFKPSNLHEIRIFNTFVDVVRQNRNNRPDTFESDGLPYSRGIVGRTWVKRGDTKDFLEYAFRHETKTRWTFPIENYEYQYWKLFGSIFFSNKIPWGFYLHFRSQYDRKYEARFPIRGSSITPEGWKTDRWFTILRIVVPEIGPQNEWEWTMGIEHAYRFWIMDDGRNVYYRDYLPHINLQIPGFRTVSKKPDFFNIGYVLTLHRVVGNRTLNPNDAGDGRIEHRLNLSYDFNFKQQDPENLRDANSTQYKDTAVLRLMATGDLDALGSRDSFEGGLTQLQVFF